MAGARAMAPAKGATTTTLGWLLAVYSRRQDLPHRRSRKQIFQGDHLDRQAACRRWSRLSAGAAALSEAKGKRKAQGCGSLKGKLREGEGSDSPGTEILRCAQDDMRGWEGRPSR